jgi:hypothetical protein
MSKIPHFNSSDAILLAGGYGVVGQQIAQIIRQRHPTLPILLAGRNPERAEPLARWLTRAAAIQLDVERPDPTNGIKPRAILAAVNDPHDHLLMDAVRDGIPYVDITRWSERVQRVVSTMAKLPLRAPVMLSSGWTAGMAAIIAMAASRQLRRVDRIEISILYSVKDKAGPNSVEYLDRLATPFNVMLNGESKQVLPYTDPRKINFPGGREVRAYRFDTPDQFTLPTTTGAQTVTARIALDDARAANLLVFLTRSGIWKLIRGKRFTSLRRLLLYNPGSGASHEIVIETSGLDKNNAPKTIRAAILDPKGQTHLTALGSLVQLERILGLDGAPPSAAGIIYPETAPQIESALKVLMEFGVSILSA